MMPDLKKGWNFSSIFRMPGQFLLLKTPEITANILLFFQSRKISGKAFRLCGLKIEKHFLFVPYFYNIFISYALILSHGTRQTYLEKAAGKPVIT